MEGVPGLTAPPVGAPELTKWDSAGVNAWLLGMQEPWAAEMAETLQLAGTTGAELASLTLQDLLEADELGISEDHAHRLLAAVLAECSNSTGIDSEAEAEAEREPELESELAGHPGAGEQSAEDLKREQLLRRELDGLKLGAINKRAIAEGVDDDTIEAAMDSDDPKAALIDALVLNSAGSAAKAREGMAA